jgi:hypothetical protein
MERVAKLAAPITKLIPPFPSTSVSDSGPVLLREGRSRGEAPVLVHKKVLFFAVTFSVS